MVRHPQAEAEQPDDGTDQPLCLPISEVEDDAQRQGGQDRQWRVPGLTTACCARLGRPRGDRLIRKLHRQAAALTQAGVVGRPVCDPVPLPRNMVTPVLVQLEGQGEHPDREGTPPLSRSGSGRHWMGIRAPRWRTHSLFRQGCMLYDLIPNMPEHRLEPLIQAFNAAVANAGVFASAVAMAK